MHDVIIIGAGVTGSACAMELSKYELDICVLEKAEDVCEGTSKANSGIAHAGYDAKPGTLKARLNVRGNELLGGLSERLDIPFIRTGTLVAANDIEGDAVLFKLLTQGEKNGVPGLEIIRDRGRLFEMEPNLAEDVRAALYAPTGGIVCPFELNLGMAENACANGAAFRFNSTVENIERIPGGWRVETDREKLESKVVINAAGVYADTLHNMVSPEKIHITARRGEYCLLDKTAGGHVRHVVFSTPGKMGKGVLVTPTTHGNLLIGPTAQDVPDKQAVNTTAAGIAEVLERAGLSVKDIPFRQVITSFAGLRAHEDGGDFVIGQSAGAFGFIDAAGIESPGLTAAPAVGEMVAKIVCGILSPAKRAGYIDTRKGVVKAARLSVEERNELIKKEPAFGAMICRCENISEGEILEAIHRPLGAKSLDGVKRRCRAGMGRCQGGFCSPKVMEILSKELGVPMEKVTKSGGNSRYIVGKTR